MAALPRYVFAPLRRILPLLIRGIRGIRGSSPGYTWQPALLPLTGCAALPPNPLLRPQNLVEPRRLLVDSLAVGAGGAIGRKAGYARPVDQIGRGADLILRAGFSRPFQGQLAAAHARPRRHPRWQG